MASISQNKKEINLVLKDCLKELKADLSPEAIEELWTKERLTNK